MPKPEPELPRRTAWYILNRIRETWEDVTGTEPEPPQKPEPVQDQDQKRGRGRPASLRSPAPIPNSPEAIARAIMSGPPKKKWRYLKDQENRPSDVQP